MCRLKACLSAFAFLLCVLLSSAQALQTGEPVVPFSLANLTTGETVTPDQYKGKLLVLFFVGLN